jgi:hypothetical protein
MVSKPGHFMLPCTFWLFLTSLSVVNTNSILALMIASLRNCDSSSATLSFNSLLFAFCSLLFALCSLLVQSLGPEMPEHDWIV